MEYTTAQVRLFLDSVEVIECANKRDQMRIIAASTGTSDEQFKKVWKSFNGR